MNLQVLLKISMVNVLETINHVAASEIDVGFAAAATLSRALKEKKISQLQALRFRNKCAIMLAIIVPKIKKSHLQYNFSRKLASMDSRIMASKPESAVKMFQKVLNRLKRSGRLVNKQILNLLSTKSSSLKPRSITTTNLLQTVLPRKDWTSF